MTRLTTITQFKEYVGKTIFAVPTGNAAIRRDKGHYEKMEVVSVKRKYVGLRIEGWSREGMYCPETGATQSEINNGYVHSSGYKFYSDLESIEKEREVQQKLSEIKEVFRGYGKPNLNDKQIEQIHEIIKQGAW